MESIRDEVLLVSEVAKDIRCSKAHVSKLINGLVKGCSKLPAIHIGRRIVVLSSVLEQWKKENVR